MEYRPILKLSDEVIGQIAAGEVVERPAAAVKELVENSIDAGATAVTVELKDGGVTYIRVSDNGKGIPAGQIRMAFERHATSKLTTADELYDVHTLGFRGEALASIAAIAKVTCTSRTADAEYGIKAQVDAGAFMTISEAASPVGTTVVVKDLFYNAPVRLKFLKKATTEAAMVSDYIMRLILSRPDVAFRFVNQGKTVYRSAGDGTLESAIYCVYGKEALREMKRVKGSLYGAIVDGYVGVGELSRGNRLQQSFFINGRYFRDEQMSKALEAGTEGYVMIGRFPICALSLQLPYKLVDVNVHPNKLEVRFQNPDAVAKALEELTREALRTVTIHERLLGGTSQNPDMTPVPVQVIRLHQEPSVNTDVEDLSPTTAQPDEAPIAYERSGMAQPWQTMPKQEADRADESRTAPDRMEYEPLNVNQPNSAKAPALHEGHTYPTVLPETPMDRQPEAHALELAQAGDPSGVPPEIPMEEKHPEQTERSDAKDELIFTLPERAFSVHTPVLVSKPIAQEQPVQETMSHMDVRPQLRYIGAAFKTYLLFEAGERLLLVDQHAAHERVLFDRFMARYSGTIVSQRLLAPQVLRFTARDVALLEEIGESLTEAGFDIEPFDATSVAVRAIPVILGGNEPVRDLLLDVLDETQTQRGKITRERLKRRVAQLACKHAIKGGDTLSNEDVKALLEQMLATGVQPTCPHGRPIVNEFTRRELEKRFKRIQ